MKFRFVQHPTQGKLNIFTKLYPQMKIVKKKTNKQKKLATLQVPPYRELGSTSIVTHESKQQLWK